MTGILQNFARKYQKPIDGIAFNMHMQKTPQKDIKTKPEDGCYIHGFFLQGCRWDAEMGSLVDSKPKELFTSMPVIWLEPEENRTTPTEGVYVCPAYKTLRRAGVLSTTGHSTNFVVYIEIPTKEPQSKWIKAGVALFTGSACAAFTKKREPFFLHQMNCHIFHFPNVSPIFFAALKY